MRSQSRRCQFSSKHGRACWKIKGLFLHYFVFVNDSSLAGQEISIYENVEDRFEIL